MTDLIPQSSGYVWLDVIVAAFLIVGSFFVFVAAFGVIRFQDVLLRMHAATKAGALGSIMILTAIAIYFHDLSISSRAIAGAAFLLITAPVAAHLIGRAAYKARVPLHERTSPDELREYYYNRASAPAAQEPNKPEEASAPDTGNTDQ